MLSEQAVASASPSKNKGLQEDDEALARLLQEQERAYFFIGGGLQQFGPAGADPWFDRSSSADALTRESLQAGSGSAGLSDEDLARRFQEEELAALYGSAGLADELAMAPSDASEEQELTYEDLSHLGDVAGRVSRGISAATLSALPEACFAQLQGQHDCKLDRCCVCQCSYEPEDCTLRLPCSHFYHKPCITQWLSENKVCPICAREVGP